jgi:predicted secreted protein
MQAVLKRRHFGGDLLVALCLTVSAVTAGAQSLPAPEPLNVVQLSASGSVEAQQDWLTVTLSATREGAEPALVQTQLRQALDSAMAAVKQSAEPGSMEVRSGAFNLQPRYGKEGKISTWIGTAELVLEGSDFARIGTAVSRAQPMTISSLAFSLSRQATARLEAQAQGLAIGGFKAKAADIARDFGFSGYTLREVNVTRADQPGGPVPRFMAMAAKGMVADAPMPMESGKSLVVVTVSGAVQLK